MPRRRDPRQGSAHARAVPAYHPGNTDLAWTRLTPWRALLAAALDQQPTSHRRLGDRRADQPERRPARRLAADRLKVRVERKGSRGPRHHRGRSRASEGPIVIRAATEAATFSSPTEPTGRSR